MLPRLAFSVNFNNFYVECNTSKSSATYTEKTSKIRTLFEIWQINWTFISNHMPMPPPPSSSSWHGEGLQNTLVQLVSLFLTLLYSRILIKEERHPPPSPFIWRISWTTRKYWSCLPHGTKLSPQGFLQYLQRIFSTKIVCLPSLTEHNLRMIGKI